MSASNSARNPVASGASAPVAIRRRARRSSAEMRMLIDCRLVRASSRELSRARRANPSSRHARDARCPELRVSDRSTSPAREYRALLARHATRHAPHHRVQRCAQRRLERRVRPSGMRCNRARRLRKLRDRIEAICRHLLQRFEDSRLQRRRRGTPTGSQRGWILYHVAHRDSGDRRARERRLPGNTVTRVRVPAPGLSDLAG